MLTTRQLIGFYFERAVIVTSFLPVVFSAAADGNLLVIVRKLVLSQTQTDDSALRHASNT